MNDVILGVILIILGVLLILWTISESKNTPAKFTYSYVNHLKGYVGGVALILFGFIKILN
jgi:uncharacterized membrane protein